MYFGERISRWAMGVGVKQLTLTEQKGWRFADHIRHLHHHLRFLRRDEPLTNVQAAIHLLACSKILGKISFEASLLTLDIDYNELESIQQDIRLTLRILEHDDRIIDMSGYHPDILEISSRSN